MSQKKEELDGLKKYLAELKQDYQMAVNRKNDTMASNVREMIYSQNKQIEEKEKEIGKIKEKIKKLE